MSFISDLAFAIPEKFFEYVLTIVNAPLQPLLSFIKSLLSEPVNISLFSPLWAIMAYILSLFYGLLLLYSGFNFIISGYDAAKRETAKVWLRNILIMVVLVQASFFLYYLILEISALLTTGVLSLVSNNFFLLTADNLINLGLEILFGIFYAIILLLTALILIVRYIVVAIGVVFAPLAIFLYFVPPLRSYGKAILNFLGINIFITFIAAIIMLASSKLIEISFFSNFKILLMISTFLLVNLVMLYFLLFAAIKSALNLASGISGKTALVKSLFGS